MDVERQFERIVSSIGDPDAPREEHRRRLRKQVLAAVESAGATASMVYQPPKRTIIMNNSFIRWSAAAAVFIVCVTLVCLHLSHSPSAAWADVAKNLNRAQTLSFKVAVYQGEKLRSEQMISFLNPDRMRIESEGGFTVIDWAQGKMLSLIPQYKQAVAVTLTDKPTDAETSARRNWLARLKEIVESKNAREIGAETFEGRTCKGWQVANAVGATTVWADEKSAEIVRVETKKNIVRTVVSNIKFNPELDESQFSLEAPKDYSMITDMSVARKDASENDLLLLLRAWAGGNGDVFPDSLMDQHSWLRAASKYDWSKEKLQDEDALKGAIGRAFLQINMKQNWVYRGKGVKLGDAKQPIFWKPIGRGKYRVIYGNLSIRQVDEKDLPVTQSPALPPPKKRNDR